MFRLLRKFLKLALRLVVVLVVVVALFFGFLTIVEYRPEDVETIEIEKTEGSDSKKVKTNEELSIVTWNTGYAGLGKECDSVMDGGGSAPAPDEVQVNKYFEGIKSFLKETDADIEILQEVDYCSSRTFRMNQLTDYNLGNGSYARNYKCLFTPYPLDYIGTADSGIYTTTSYDIESSSRYSLPCPFSWPSRVVNLKRCFTASYLPVEGSDKKLVIVNFHLEAYDDGDGKIAQTKQLMEFIANEYENGNWVIAGGDWNQTMPDSLELYPNTHKDLWNVGYLEETDIVDGFTWAYDLSTPTCRLLNQAYDPADTENTQYYVIDGFVISDNISLVSVENQNLDFEDSDHNPVLMKFVLN